MGGAGWWQWQAEVSYFVTLPPHRVLVFRVVCTDRCSSLLCNSNRATFCDSLTNAHHILLTEELKSDSDENPTHATRSFCPHATLLLLFFTMIINSQSIESKPNITIVVQSSATTHLHTSKNTMMKLVLASLLVGPAVAFVPPPAVTKGGVRLPRRLRRQEDLLTASFTIGNMPGALAPMGFFDPPPRIRRQGRMRRHAEAEALPREAER